MTSAGHRAGAGRHERRAGATPRTIRTVRAGALFAGSLRARYGRGARLDGGGSPARSGMVAYPELAMAPIWLSLARWLRRMSRRGEGEGEGAAGGDGGRQASGPAAGPVGGMAGPCGVVERHVFELRTIVERLQDRRPPRTGRAAPRGGGTISQAGGGAGGSKHEGLLHGPQAARVVAAVAPGPALMARDGAPGGASRRQGTRASRRAAGDRVASRSFASLATIGPLLSRFGEPRERATGGHASGPRHESAGPPAGASSPSPAAPATRGPARRAAGPGDDGGAPARGLGRPVRAVLGHSSAAHARPRGHGGVLDVPLIQDVEALRSAPGAARLPARGPAARPDLPAATTSRASGRAAPVSRGARPLAALLDADEARFPIAPRLPGLASAALSDLNVPLAAAHPPGATLPLVARAAPPPAPRPSEPLAFSFVRTRERTVDVRQLQETVTRRLEETLHLRVREDVETVVARELAPDSEVAQRLGERISGDLYENLVLEKERLGWG